IGSRSPVWPDMRSLKCVHGVAICDRAPVTVGIHQLRAECGLTPPTDDGDCNSLCCSVFATELGVVGSSGILLISSNRLLDVGPRRVLWVRGCGLLLFLLFLVRCPITHDRGAIAALLRESVLAVCGELVTASAGLGKVTRLAEVGHVAPDDMMVSGAAPVNRLMPVLFGELSELPHAVVDLAKP